MQQQLLMLVEQQLCSALSYLQASVSFDHAAMHQALQAYQ
jgi:hypothetical protein